MSFEPGFLRLVPGSCLASAGNTRVLCTALLEDGVPPWLAGRGQGWLTAEYAMLPASTQRRKARDGRKSGALDGRTVEIQRLIGRVLRPLLDRTRIGERTLAVDCDVLEADGGTRTTAINGAIVAVRHALAHAGLADALGWAGAISVGLIDGEVRLDLDYREDSRAEADMNIAMTDDGRYLEVQASAEGRAFGAEELLQALAVARGGISAVIAQMKAVDPRPGSTR